GYAAQGSRLLADTLGRISRAQAELAEELDVQREQFDQEIRQAATTLADTQRELDAAIADERHCAESVAVLQAKLNRITPSSVLAEFLDDRFASDDYRRHLGVPALVRQDLERLSRLIQQRHDTGSAEGIDDRHVIDRVVLYIDDLDRCPTDRVIKVLEAVHLLLAFPLFVVVVAVDARWLESSLREHYTQLRADAPVPPDPAAAPETAAAPSDYLEKIFQVPFWVRPLGTDTRRRMVRRLLETNLAAPVSAAGPGTAQATGPELSDADLPEFTRLVESFAVTEQADQPWPDPAMLTVTGPELRRLEDISTLISATPRAVKRFINVYLLLRSVGRRRGWPLPEQGQVALLLAIATGLPELADKLLPRLVTPPTGEPLTLGTGLAEPGTGPAAAAQLARLNAWLDDHPGWRDVALSGTGHWIELILRFRFDRGRAGSG
ncbi:MAG TPA: P-loop NTPase fold protein, partial [Pseudonocardiaceae bacterium]|nr:P-loop NTPase fold protein [Pseudonocardiaceae bacterium]